MHSRTGSDGASGRDGQLKAYCHDGFWQCMDTYHGMKC
jgi:hypothetical protein